MATNALRQVADKFVSLSDDADNFKKNMDMCIASNNLTGALVYATLLVYTYKVFYEKYAGVESLEQLNVYTNQGSDAQKRIKKSIASKYMEAQSTLAGLQERLKNAPITGVSMTGGVGEVTPSGETDTSCYRFTELKFEKGSKQCDAWFSTTVGLDDVKDDLLSMIVDPFIYKNLTDERPKGILLYGPPGTGKTLLAKACVNEITKQVRDRSRKIKVFFYAPTAADLKGDKVGQTEKYIKAAFQCAADKAKDYEQKNGPGSQAISILFIDEADDLAKRRDVGDPNDIITVNAFLQQIDGVRSSDKVLVIAATNFPWNLDKAFLDRFDRQIMISLPTSEDIAELLNRRLNRFVKRTLESSSVKTSKKRSEALENQYDGCVPPSQDDKRFIWTDQRVQGFFPGLSTDDITILSKWMSGEIPFPFTGKSNNNRYETSDYVKDVVNRALSGYDDTTRDEIMNKGRTTNLSNRTVDKIFRTVRLSTLKKAKTANLVVRTKNGYSNGDMFFSADSLSDEQWLSQLQNLEQTTDLNDKFFVFNKRETTNLVQVEIPGLAGMHPAIMLNSDLFPLLKVDYRREFSNVKSVYVSADYGDVDSSDVKQVDDLYFQLWVMSRLELDKQKQPEGTVLSLDFQMSDYRTKLTEEGEQGLRDEFAAFKRLSTQEIHARIRGIKEVSIGQKVSDLFKLRVALFDRIKNSTYNILFEVDLPITDGKKPNADDERIINSLVELFGKNGMNYTRDDIFKMTKAEMISKFKGDTSELLEQYLKGISGVTKHEKVYLLVKKRVDYGNKGALNKLLSATTFGLLGGRVEIKQEADLISETAKYKQARNDQLSTAELLNKSDRYWIVPSSKFEVDEAGGHIRDEKGFAVFKDTTSSNTIHEILSGRTNLKVGEERGDIGEFVVVSNRPSLYEASPLAVLHGTTYLWVKENQVKIDKDEEVEIQFKGVLSINEKPEYEEYYTSWNITFEDFVGALLLSDSSISREELELLYEYEAAPSRANELRGKQLALANNASNEPQD